MRTSPIQDAIDAAGVEINCWSHHDRTRRGGPARQGKEIIAIHVQEV